jgi:hypothetical protein
VITGAYVSVISQIEETHPRKQATVLAALRAALGDFVNKKKKRGRTIEMYRSRLDGGKCQVVLAIEVHKNVTALRMLASIP